MSIERVRERSESDETSAPPIDSRAVTDDPEIDRSPGSGSLTVTEGWVVESEMDGLNDGRYGTRTTFYAWEASGDGPSQQHRDPEDRRSWSDLAKWNDGMWEPDRSVQNFGVDVERWTQTFCNFLDLPEYQYERVEYVMNDIDLTDFRPRKISVEKVILGVISLVVDSENDVDDIEDWDIDEWIVYDDAFETLMCDVGMVRDDGEPERGSLWEIRKIVQSESDYFEE